MLSHHFWYNPSHLQYFLIIPCKYLIRSQCKVLSSLIPPEKCVTSCYLRCYLIISSKFGYNVWYYCIMSYYSILRMPMERDRKARRRKKEVSLSLCFSVSLTVLSGTKQKKQKKSFLLTPERRRSNRSTSFEAYSSPFSKTLRAAFAYSFP